MMKCIRRTKIVATLGPSTDKKDNLKKIIKSGVNVLRLNFSHGNSKEHQYRVKQAKLIMQEMGCYLSILGDLQGPKIRIGIFENNKIFLKKGNNFILDYNYSKYNGNEKIVQVEYSKLSEEVKKNDILLLDDGKIKLKVLNTELSKVFTEVLIGGVLSNKKGINKLGGGLSADCLTKKDEKDIILAANLGVDYLAISFPRCSEDLLRTKLLLKKAGSRAKVIAKIERAEVVFNQNIIDEIINNSDAIMVARGDLGVEISDPELAGVQKKLIKRTRQLNKIVITATQMMESMITNSVPTRAEVMDVANAVLDGTDAVMLSAETASGKNPVETVISMSKICQGAEKIPVLNTSKHRLNTKFNSIKEAIAMSSMYTASHLTGVSSIINLTHSKKIAIIASRITSKLPIFSLTNKVRDLNLMALYRGVIPIFFKKINNEVNEENQAIAFLLSKNLIVTGSLVVIIALEKNNNFKKIYYSKIVKVSI
ncbi:pyruvate kinase [Buchnera aphidicola]|uniref:Pyruvate kinase n=1 Tax=Buchnera aphidicola (Anoecia oenotherae) TaxID=1241833 RepID=A0A4D6XRF1_9GAMM|nr:pyruvate kinase [Buchnera aphidicola]QCI19376.1 pyruvate kinase [Buchnera aphidicola (Anoecia oenotherae)]